MTATEELAQAESKIVWSKTEDVLEDGKEVYVLRADFGTGEHPRAFVGRVLKEYGADGLRMARQCLTEDVALALR